MRDDANPYALAAWPAFFSAAMHGVALIVGPAEMATTMITGGLMWVAFGLGLRAGSRLMAYLAFLLGLFGGVYAMNACLSLFGTASAVFGAMWIADWLVALLLFGPLWRRAPARA